jgi:hypothetical protein
LLSTLLTYFQTPNKKKKWSSVFTTLFSSSRKNLIIVQPYYERFMSMNSNNTLERTTFLTINASTDNTELENNLNKNNDFSNNVKLESWVTHSYYKEYFVTFIYAQLNLIIYFTTVIQLLSISVGSSFLLRFWTFMGSIFVIYISFNGILGLMFMLRVVLQDLYLNRHGTEHREKTATLSTRKEFWQEKTMLFLYLYMMFFLKMIMFISSSVSFTFFLLPYELETYQSDYSSSTVRILVSVLTYVLLLVVVTEVWDKQWKSAANFDVIVNNLANLINQNSNLYYKKRQ